MTPEEVLAKKRELTINYRLEKKKEELRGLSLLELVGESGIEQFLTDTIEDELFHYEEELKALSDEELDIN